jgi:preprotein translocase subunit YajC
MNAFLIQIMPLVLIVGIFYALVVMPEKKRRRKLQELIDNLKVGDKVITTGGLYGTILTVRDTSLVIRSDQSKLEIARSAVVGLQTEAGEGQAVAAR